MGRCHGGGERCRSRANGALVSFLCALIHSLITARFRQLPSLFLFSISLPALLHPPSWHRYRQARGFNKTAVAILVGTKYDTFAALPAEEQNELTKQVRAAVEGPWGNGARSRRIRGVGSLFRSAVFPALLPAGCQHED